MNRNIRTLFIFLFIYIFSLFPSQGIIVIDFEDITSGKTRIIALNTETQQLLLYKEVNGTSADEIEGHKVNLSSEKVYVQLFTDSHELMIVRSRFEIVCPEGYDYDHMVDDFLWASEEIKVKSPKKIQSILPKPKKREAQDHGFPISIEGAKGVKTLESLSKDDKGNLGELCATLTMLSFGYIQHPSKYGGDNGFDGVFESCTNNYLWLTQSKQEKKQRTAANIMDRSLNEGKIFEVISEMRKKGEQEVQQTAALISEYLEEKPEAVYKMTYRMMDKGFAQCQTEPVSMHELLKHGKFIGAPEKEKRKAVRRSLQHCEESPQSQFVLALNTISLASISKEEAFRLLGQAYDEQANTATTTPEVHISPLPSPTIKVEENVQTSPSILAAPREEGASNLPIQRQGHENPMQVYNRDNLYNFLNYLNKSKKQGKRDIAAKLEGVRDGSASSIQRLWSDKAHNLERDYKHVWNGLLSNYSEEFQEWLSQ